MSNPPEQLLLSSTRPKVVLVGGGHGPAVTGAGIAEHWPEADVTALIATCDSGGSTGQLRAQFNTPPVGDIRRVISALSPHSGLAAGFEQRFGEDDTTDAVAVKGRQLLSHLFERRDVSSEDWSHAAWIVERTTDLAGKLDTLRGHNFGNLVMTMLASLDKPEEEPSLTKAADTVGVWLEARGRVLPMTETHHNLVMEDDGQTLVGEHIIDEHVVVDPRTATIRLQAVNPDEAVAITPDAQAVLQNADMVVLGPGSVFTSIQAAIAAEGVTEALKLNQERGGALVAIGNLVVGADTHGMPVGEILRKLQESLGHDFTHVVYNTDTQVLPRGQALEFGPDNPDDTWQALGLPLAESGTVAVDPNDTVVRSAVRHDTAGVTRVLRDQILAPQMGVQALIHA